MSYPAPGRNRKFSRWQLWLGAAVIVVMVLMVGVVSFLFASGGGSKVARYEAADFMTPLPFTEPVLNEDVGIPEVRGPSGGGASPVSYIPSDSCDPEKLKRQLAERPEAARAWAGIFGIETSEIDSFIDGLSSATLVTPLRVTNHDYESGEAIELQSVLAVGTAILVDDAGNPVIRCACGNPLKPAKGEVTEVTGAPAGFDLAEVPDEVTLPEPRSAGTDCAEIQLRNGSWATVRITEGTMSCEDAVGVAHDYTENVATGLPVVISCRPTDDRSSVCRSSNGSVTVVAAGVDGTPPTTTRTTTTTSRSSTTQSAPLSGPGTRCGTVTTAIDESPVIISEGRMSCAEAMRVAGYYFDNLDRVQGSGGHLMFDGWHCSSSLANGTRCSESSRGLSLRVGD